MAIGQGAQVLLSNKGGFGSFPGAKGLFLLHAISYLFLKRFIFHLYFDPFLLVSSSGRLL